LLKMVGYCNIKLAQEFQRNSLRKGVSRHCLETRKIHDDDKGG